MISDDSKYGQIELIVSGSPLRALFPLAIRASVCGLFMYLLWKVLAEVPAFGRWSGLDWFLVLLVGLPGLIAAGMVLAILPKVFGKRFFLLTDKCLVDCAANEAFPWWCIRNVRAKEASRYYDITTGQQTVTLSYEGNDGKRHSVELSAVGLNLTGYELAEAIKLFAERYA